MFLISPLISIGRRSYGNIYAKDGSNSWWRDIIAMNWALAFVIPIPLINSNSLPFLTLVAVAPIPGSLLLLGSGILGLVGWRRLS